jgi:hypothetical protein
MTRYRFRPVLLMDIVCSPMLMCDRGATFARYSAAIKNAQTTIALARSVLYG